MSSFWARHKDRTLVGLFTAYVVVLAIGTVDSVFLDSMIFAPALDRQILGMVDVLRDREVGTADSARKLAGRARERLAGIRLEQEPSPLEKRLQDYAERGGALEEGLALLEEARKLAVVNLVDNDEFSLKICIRALDPDLVMRLWIPGLSSGDVRVKTGCLEALKQISGQKDGFGYDPKGPIESQRLAIAEWWRWYDQFMDERRRPAPPVPQAGGPGQMPPAPMGQPPATPPTVPQTP